MRSIYIKSKVKIEAERAADSEDRCKSDGRNIKDREEKERGEA